MVISREFLVIGASHWDTLGKAIIPLSPSDDVPGQIISQPGGVALNAACLLAESGLQTSLISAVGSDSIGKQLIRHLKRYGLNTRNIHKSSSHSTDRYMAIEYQDMLVSAIADCRCLDHSEDILMDQTEAWLTRKKHRDLPEPTVIVDGNLSTKFLHYLNALRSIKDFELIFIAASPAKAKGVMTLATAETPASIYLNRLEASSVTQTEFMDATAAATHLLRHGFERVVVTDGGRAAADGNQDEIISVAPDEQLTDHITGAGDIFSIAHIMAVRQGLDRSECLEVAHRAAAHRPAKAK